MDLKNQVVMINGVFTAQDPSDKVCAPPSATRLSSHVSGKPRDECCWTRRWSLLSPTLRVLERSHRVHCARGAVLRFVCPTLSPRLSFPGLARPATGLHWAAKGAQSEFCRIFSEAEHTSLNVVNAPWPSR